MELRHLRYFIGVAEEENVSRAALKLHVSQPALSRQIRDLEDEIGFPLLERSAKSVRLTDAGRIFFIEAKEVMKRVEEGVARARKASAGGKVDLHVGYAPSLTVLILPNALRAFQKSMPEARAVLHDLSTEEMLTHLRESKLQIALMVRPTKAMLRGLVFRELARYPMCVAVSPGHPFSKTRSVSLDQAVRQPLIGYSRAEYPEYHEQLEKIFASTKRKPQIVEEHDSVTSLIAAVESGRGIALAPSCLSCMVGPRLKLLPLKMTPPDDVIVGAAWRKENLSPVGERFLESLKS